MRLVLASASPRRAELLTSAGFTFEIAPANVNETPRDAEPPADYTLRVAVDKARHVAARLRTDPDVVVLAADTEVVVDGGILGKPSSQQHARRMLHLLSGNVHEVMTGVVLVAGGREVTAVVTTRVWFTPLSQEEIDWYVSTGEPMGKAGGYAIQGRGARFIDRIDGSWSNVVGLPIATVHRLLRDARS